MDLVERISLLSDKMFLLKSIIFKFQGRSKRISLQDNSWRPCCDIKIFRILWFTEKAFLGWNYLPLEKSDIGERKMYFGSERLWSAGSSDTISVDLSFLFALSSVLYKFQSHNSIYGNNLNNQTNFTVNFLGITTVEIYSQWIRSYLNKSCFQCISINWIMFQEQLFSVINNHGYKISYKV